MLVGSAPISMPRPLFATFVFLLICAASVAAEGKSTPASARVATSDELAMLNDVLHKTANDIREWPEGDVAAPAQTASNASK